MTIQQEKDSGAVLIAKRLGFTVTQDGTFLTCTSAQLNALAALYRDIGAAAGLQGLRDSIKGFATKLSKLDSTKALQGIGLLSRDCYLFYAERAQRNLPPESRK